MSERAAGLAIARRLVPVWLALLLLAGAALWVAGAPLGGHNTAASLGVAALKTALIALLFMQLRRPDALLRLAAGAGLLCLCFLFALTFADLLTRRPPTQPGTVTPRILHVPGPVTGRQPF